jgi:enoyl-CoA hydratase/carnithine racemase
MATLKQLAINCIAFFAGTMFSPNEALQAGFVHHVAKSDSFISSAAAVCPSLFSVGLFGA